MGVHHRVWLIVLAACGPTGPDEPSDTAELVDPVPEAGPGLVGLVGEPVTFDGSGSQHATEGRWAFGDGDVTQVGPLRVTHAYAAPGHYTASLQVAAADGLTFTDTVEVTVTWPPLATPPRQTSSVVTDGERAFVAMPDFDAIAVVELASGAVSHVDTCPRPRRLALSPDDAVLGVTCEAGTPGVRLYDLGGSTPTVRASVDLSGTGRSPFGIVIGDDLGVFVTSRGRDDDIDVLLMYDDLLRPLREPVVDDDLRGLAWMPGQLLASRHRSPDDGGRWVHIDLPDVFVHSERLRVDLLPDSDISSRGVPSYLQALAIRPDGRVAVIGGLKANTQRGLQRDGQPLTDETTVRAELRMVSLDAAEAPVGSELDTARLDDRDLISAVVYHPLGDRLFAATLGMQTIEVRDAFTLGSMGAHLDVGAGVDGLAVTPDGRLLAHARYDRELVVFDGEDSERIDLLPGPEVMAPAVLLGARIFHTSSDPRMSQDGYTSCASCHLDGEDDGRVWDFTDRGEGLRTTASLLGMRERVGGPIHWSGNFDEVQDFEHDIRGPQAGRGFLTTADWEAAGTTLGPAKAGRSVELDALAAYVESLGGADVPWADDVSEGRAVFVAAGCDDCHPDGGTTSGWLSPGVPELRDVGTLTASSGQRLGAELTGLDVPDLRGTWASPPWLHNGSAPRLRDVLVSRNSGDRHGRTSNLSAADLDALLAYLHSL